MISSGPLIALHLYRETMRTKQIQNESRGSMRSFYLVLASILISVAGCQTAQPVKTAVIDNGSFMSLWDTYSRCQANASVDQLREDALTLTNAANHSLTQEAFVLPLPGKLEKLVSAPAARFAVDLKAMAAACSLRAGSAAVQAGKLDVAKDLLQAVLNYQPQSEYAYYTLQAKTLLSDLQINLIEVTLNIPVAD